MVNGLQPHCAHTERNERRGMAMDHSIDVRTCLVDLAVDEPLQVQRPGVRSGWLALGVELDDISERDKIGCQRPRDEIAMNSLRASYADMAPGIHYVVL